MWAQLHDRAILRFLETGIFIYVRSTEAFPLLARHVIPYAEDVFVCFLMVVSIAPPCSYVIPSH